MFDWMRRNIHTWIKWGFQVKACKLTILDVGFEWPIDESGYELKVKERKKGSTSLTDDNGEFIVRRGGTLRKETPFQFYEALYMEFAHLDGTSESCIRFANKYGYLGLHPQRKNNPGAGGESLALWRDATTNMRKAVELQQENPRALLVGWPGETKVTNLKAVLVPSPLDGMPSLRIRPLSLLGGMWLQFGHILQSDQVVRACKQCGVWFVAGGERRRIDALFHQDKCRDDFNNAMKKKRKAS